jgi:hypothetical protein
MDRGRVSEDDLVEFAEGVGDRPAVESRHLAEFEINGLNETDVAVVNLFVIVIFDLLTLSPIKKGVPNFSTFGSPRGLRARCSSMFSERAPSPPRFMGHST